MQVTDEEKRAKILAVAARLFAEQPFHKVLLSDVAKAASVGKGTLYTYFKSKEDLYFSVLYSGFSGLVDLIREDLAANVGSPVENLEMVIRETVRFAYQAPHLFEVMRTVPRWEPLFLPKWDAKRRELRGLIESIIRHGITLGVFIDSHPELTARYIPGFVRSALLYGIGTVDREDLTDHVLRFVKAAITPRGDIC
jgi:AcrR family transcriptional regulator